MARKKKIERTHVAKICYFSSLPDKREFTPPPQHTQKKAQLTKSKPPFARTPLRLLLSVGVLDDDQGELLFGRDQDLVLLRADPQEREVVLRIERADSGARLEGEREDV